MRFHLACLWRLGFGADRDGMAELGRLASGEEET
jgi:hypothetical protein